MGRKGTQPGHLTSRDIPYHMASCSAIKAEGVDGGGGEFTRAAFSQGLTEHQLTDGEPFFFFFYIICFSRSCFPLGLVVEGVLGVL